MNFSWQVPVIVQCKIIENHRITLFAPARWVAVADIRGCKKRPENLKWSFIPCDDYCSLAGYTQPSAVVVLVKLLLRPCPLVCWWMDYLSSCPLHASLQSLPRSRVCDLDGAKYERQGRYWVMCIYWEMAITKILFNNFLRFFIQNIW